MPSFIPTRFLRLQYFSLEPGDVACRATAFGSTTTSRSAGDRANDTWRGNVKELSLPAASLSRPLFDMHTRASNNAHDDDVTVSPQDLSALPALEVWQTGLPSWMSSAAWAEQGEEFEHAGPGSSGSPADGLKPCLSPNGLCTCGSSTRANQDVLGGSEEASRMASLSEVGSRGSVHCDVLSACSDAANSTFASDPLRGNGLLPREETSARYLMDDRAHRQSMPAIPSFCDDLMSSGSASFSCSSPSSLQPESETQVSQGRASKVIGTGNKRRKPKRFQTFAVLPGNTSNVNKAESKVDDLLHQMLPPKVRFCWVSPLLCEN